MFCFKTRSEDNSSEENVLVFLMMPKQPGDVEEVAMESEESMAAGFYRGTCPDPKCGFEIFFPKYLPGIVCSACGKRHEPSALKDLKAIKGDADSVLSAVRYTLINAIKPKKSADNIKVHGLCNYACKLLAPFLSYNGMDNHTGKAVPLPELGKPEVFNCAVLCDKAFRIEPQHLNVEGYGRDLSGSHEYLQGILNVVRDANGGEERLVPVHADGDGHCLVHAISRALVGRELFWHPLRLNLYENLKTNLERYKSLPKLQGFVEDDEWETIISECLPYFHPADGEQAGLRNIHILVLANVLKRPIILLDCVSQMINVGDYSGVFLPILWRPDECKNKDGVLNPPLCIAWSSNAHNHFIPLVGIKDKACPVLPRHMLQATWGVDNMFLDQYINFENGCCTIGGIKTLHDSYIQRLANAMEELFYKENSVKPQLVADVYQNIYKSKGIIGMAPEKMISETGTLVQQRLLLMCLSCETVSEAPINPSWLQKGGQDSLYDLILQERGKIEASKDYDFRKLELQFKCRYDANIDRLVPNCWQITCPVCCSTGHMRHVKGDGSIEYFDGDKSKEPDTKGKYYYKGMFYDNEPQLIEVLLPWAGKTVTDTVAFFEGESDPTRNTNAYEEAGKLVQKHFPGVFGIERLQSTVANYIIQRTARKEGDIEPPPVGADGDPDSPKFNAEEASKIILTGFQKQSVHKEELNKSETEKSVKRAIESHAPQQQAKKTTETSSKSPRPPSANSAEQSSKTPPSTHSKATPKPTSTVTSPTTTATTVGPTSPPPVSASKKIIRIVPPEGGAPKTVTLTEEISVQDLQWLVLEKTGVPVADQKLRKGGFPPEMIDLSDPDSIVPLAHGDQIIMMKTPREPAPAPKSEDCPVSKSQRSEDRTVSGHSPSEIARMVLPLLRSFDEHYPTDPIETHQSGGDSIDSSILALFLLAERSGKDFWTFMQAHPNHFSISGLFYLQAQRDCGLSPGKHVNFPYLPGKTFSYNDKLDRLELCLGETGHFEIEPDVEVKARKNMVVSTGSHGSHGHTAQGTNHNGQKTPRGHIGALGGTDKGNATFGTSGALHRGHAPQAFGGQGHTLRGQGLTLSDGPGGQGHSLGGRGHTLRDQDIKMPDDDVSLKDSIQLATQKLVDLCDPSHSTKQESIEEVEEPEGMEVAESTDHRQAKYSRMGPGFSVITPEHQTTMAEENKALLQRFSLLAEDKAIKEVEEPDTVTKVDDRTEDKTVAQEETTEQDSMDSTDDTSLKDTMDTT